MIKQIGGYAVPFVRTINGRKFRVTPVIEELSSDIEPKTRERIKNVLQKIQHDSFVIKGVYEKKMQNGDVAIMINRDPYNVFKRTGSIDKLMLFKKDGTIKVKDSSKMPQRLPEGEVNVYSATKRMLQDGMAVFKESITKVFSTPDNKLRNLEQNIYTPNTLYRYQIGDDSFISRTFSEGYGHLGDPTIASRVKKLVFKDSQGRWKTEYSQVQNGNFLTQYDNLI